MSLEVVLLRLQESRTQAQQSPAGLLSSFSTGCSSCKPTGRDLPSRHGSFQKSGAFIQTPNRKALTYYKDTAQKRPQIYRSSHIGGKHFCHGARTSSPRGPPVNDEAEGSTLASSQRGSTYLKN